MDWQKVIDNLTNLRTLKNENANAIRRAENYED